VVSRNYLAMTHAEFETHWDERYAQLARVHRRTLLYGALLLLPAVVVLYVLASSVGAPMWAFALLGCVEGLTAAKLGRWLAQRHETDL
jgi:hypothetical protein